MVFFVCLLVFLLSPERGREGEREGEKHQCEKHSSVASCTCPHQRPNPQPRHVPLLGIEPVTFPFAGQCPPTEPHQPGRECSCFKEVHTEVVKSKWAGHLQLTVQGPGNICVCVHAYAYGGEGGRTYASKANEAKCLW